MHFIDININSLLAKIDEVRYIVAISEIKADETIFSSKLEVDGYDLVILD